MQRIGLDRWKRIIFIALPIVIIAVLVGLDQLTKYLFKNLYLEKGRTIVIDGFFYFTYTVNTGAAWSFLADVSWGQTFFKILTSVSLVIFTAFIVYAIKKDLKWLTYSLALVIGGTIGNFIDRLIFSSVTDFISFQFGNYYFPVFNLADSFLVVGVIMLIVYFLFFDDNALFKKKNAEKEDDKPEGTDVDNGKENISNN